MKDYYWLNSHSRLFLSRGYLREDQEAEDRIREIADNAEEILKIDGFSEKFQSYMAKGFYSLSTPVWTNFGNKRGLPVSCFGSYIDDTMVSILTKTAEVGIMSKMGGGTSGYFGKLRPRGAKISVGGESSGPTHFMELFDVVSDVVSQGSARRGSFAAYLPVEHNDIEEFLQIRSEGHKIQNMSIGVTISDQWMQEMVDGDKSKRKIWAKIVQKRFESGYPYILFSDTVNNNAPPIYKEMGMRINASNLCVAPETLILTKEGYYPICDLVNCDISVWNGKEWSKTKVIKTGSNQKLVKVVLSNGQVLECTPYHKWYIVDDYENQRKGILTEKRTHELKIGDKLCKFDTPIIDSNEPFLSPYTHGLYCADGCLENATKKRISLYGEKKYLVEYLDVDLDRGEDSSGRRNVIVNNKIADKFIVPINSSIDIKLRWLEGYFDGDGSICRNGTNESIQAVSIHFNFLKEIQLLLQTIGIQSKISDAHEAGDKLLPDGNGGYKLYSCKETKRILISSNGLYKLSQLGFNPKRLKFSNRLPNREASKFVEIVEILDEERYDDTYCVNEPLEHKAVFNGILTGNCSEICLSSDEKNSFVCVLSSLNLYHWDEIVNTDAIETMIYFLDAVNGEFVNKTKHIKYMDDAHNFAKTQRALGMGVLGWHSFLQSKMIPFESMQAKLLNTSIWKIIRERSDSATEQLAKLFGEPLLLKGTGRRNVTTLAVAPTTSSSFILNQISKSIEPLNSNYFVDKLAKGVFTYKNPELKNLLKEKGKNTDEVWKSILVRGGSVQHLDFLSKEEKDVFKTFGEISQKEIVIQAAQRQKYIDQSQSLNMLIPPNTKPKDVSELLIDGWKMGIKTFYYQRGANPAQELARNILNCVSCEA